VTPVVPKVTKELAELDRQIVVVERELARLREMKARAQIRAAARADTLELYQ
jgi:hypothetical protein